MSRKIALVTGAGRGIGKAIALKLAQAGYDLGIHYSTSAEGAMDTLEQVRALGAKAEVYHADIRDVEMMITDEKCNPEIGARIQDAGIRVRIVRTAEP